MSSNGKSTRYPNNEQHGDQHVDAQPEQTKTRIVWNGQGGELDSITVTHSVYDDQAVASALAKMIRGTVVNAGDSFIVEAVS